MYSVFVVTAGGQELKVETQLGTCSVTPPTVVECASVTGGGTLPGMELPSAGIALDGDAADGLRAGDPPVIARIEDGRTVCDLRTVDPADDAVLAKAVAAVASA